MKRLHRLFLVFAPLLAALTATAQSAREELQADPRRSGCNFVAYPGPQQARLTPAPRGKRPFYISHYGRHGSRYQAKAQDYDYAYRVLLRASSQGALSPLGSDVLQRLAAIRQKASGRLGDLTPLGAQQQQAIARRMVERFPQVFRGEAVVDARSTTTPRCILSMSAALQQLVRMNPRLVVSQDASEHDHYYMRPPARAVTSQAALDAHDAFCRQHPCWQRVVEGLFADTAYMHRYVNGERLNYYLFRVASNLQSSEPDDGLSLYDLFTPDEIYENWRRENTWWFLGYGFSTLNGGTMPYAQRALLRTLIEQADSCLLLDRPGCQLRYGHETILLPLVCLLNLNGYGETIDNLEQLDQQGWACHRIFPMAANVQFVFYRSSPRDADVLFKVLLNEDEATLPLSTDCAPYYHWSDFRRHYLQLLDDYENSQH